jgi:hypothetical protein
MEADDRSPQLDSKPSIGRRLANAAWGLAFLAPGLAIAAVEALLYAYESDGRLAEQIALALAFGIFLLNVLALKPARLRRWLFARRWPLAFSGVVLVAGLLTAEYFLERLMLAPPVAKKGALTQPDRELGFAPIPGARSRWMMPGVYDATYQINALGARGVDADAGDDAEQWILAVGCSLTFGLGVNDDETWPARLGEHLGEGAQVVNGGVIAYGPQQMALRARRLAAAIEPDIILVGLARDHLTRLGANPEWNESLRREGWNLPRLRIEGDSPNQARWLVRMAGDFPPLPDKQRALRAGQVVIEPSPGENILVMSLHRALLAAGGGLAGLAPGAGDEAGALQAQREQQFAIMREALEAFAALESETRARVILVFLPEPELAGDDWREAFVEFTRREGKARDLDVWDIGEEAAQALGDGPWRLNPFFEPHYHPAALDAIGEALAGQWGKN